MVLREKALHFYRFMTTRIFRDNTKGTIFFKNMVYCIVLFFAKKKGSLLIFFTEKEKLFESLTDDDQYQIFLKNFESNMCKSEKVKKSNLKFDIVYDISVNIDTADKIIECLNLQHFENFITHFIVSRNNFKKIKQKLEKTNIKYNLILKENTSIQKLFNTIIINSQNDYIIFLKDKLLRQDFLNHVSYDVDESHADIIYCDEDSVLNNGYRFKPIFKPNWSPQLFLSSNYIGNSAVFSMSLLKEAGGFNEEIPDNFEFDLLIRLTNKTKKISHMPYVLLSEFKKSYKKNILENKKIIQQYLKEKQILAEVCEDNNGNCSIKQKFDSKSPLISILIPTKNNHKFLQRCISSIKKSTYQNYEIIIINNGSDLEFNDDKCTVITYDEPFNFSKINNFGVRYAKGEHILFLNDDVEVINEDWLEYLLFYSMQNNVGVVGSLLLYPKSMFYPATIQHGGVTLGISGPATHSFAYLHYSSHNYLNLDKVTRNVSALTAACMMIKKQIFDEIGGFDPKFVVAFGDVDICLRIKDKGFQIVYCPDSKLYHAESATRGRRHPLSDEIEMYRRWEDQIIDGDNFYNPNQTHMNRNFRISPCPSKITAISVLKEVFYFRKDLQVKILDYPNNLSQMIDWAATEGVTKDIARNILMPYNKFYLNNSSKQIKEIAIAIYKFNHSQDLQHDFPDVFGGKFINLLSNFRNS